ncbi:MAG: adenylate/guanylate cyclase domain-containing protein [Alphaproteobacteria bacterium]
MIRRVRLISGMILFAYVATHYLNHSIGLISLGAMEDGRGIFLFFWRNLIGSVLLYGALVAHMALAYWALYARQHLQSMRPGEITQFAFGFALPLLLVEHVIGTRVAHDWAGVNDIYAYVVFVLYYQEPSKGLMQLGALYLAWIHGCLGIHYWFRLKPFYRAWSPILLAVAVLLPVLAGLGFVTAAKELGPTVATPSELQHLVGTFNLPKSAEQVAPLLAAIDWIRIGVLVGLVLVFVARYARTLVVRRRGIVRVTYPDGRIAQLSPGMSVLDGARLAGIPHASVCGGRGRCSTCRVRIDVAATALPPPSPEEKRVLDRVGAPPNVRLACQIMPSADLRITPLLPSTASPRDGFRRAPMLQGHEQETAILFADLRAFTKFSETKLPYDVVFVLNRYFSSMGQAIEQAGGHLDKFIGDGVMALFGINSNGPQGCRDALSAARFMAEKLRELNQALATELSEPLRIGIGIHVGPAIVGEMGYGRATGITAIGDSVNTASRLETMTKELGVQLVVSERVARLGGVDLSGFPMHDVAVRGREASLKIRAIADACELPAIAAQPATPTAPNAQKAAASA